MSIGSHLLVLACVALASYAQNLTGFAFGLILLGLTAVLHLASLADVANVVSVLVLHRVAIVVHVQRVICMVMVNRVLGIRHHMVHLYHSLRRAHSATHHQ